MKGLLKWLGVATVFLAATIAIFLAWAYRPVSPFEPLVYTPVPPAYWPTEEWQRSTPESQGMNAKTLLEMIAFYEAEAARDPELFIDSITIVRNGYIVAEYYPNPNFPRDELHIMHSATKSIISALVGIAIEEGHIESVDATLIDFFSDREIENLDEGKKAVTIRDLLSMQSGLHTRDSHLYAYEGLFAIQKSDDWLQFALDLPMAAAPGERFDYSNIGTFLLSTILVKATGMDTLAFARRALFEPLGIEEVKWEWTSDGLPIAWARMWLKPDDMAKLGFLYLQRGYWDGQQLVPEAWISDSLAPWAYPKDVVDVLHADMSPNREASTRNWVAQRFFRPFADGYGYQWWLDRAGNYTALGTNGQYIAVAPAQNLVFVATGKSRGLAQFTPAELFYDYVLPAIEADGPLPPDTDASTALAAYADPPIRTHQATAVPDLPATALAISGSTYAMEDNPFKTDNFRFVFDPEKAYAELSYTARESWQVDFKIGLDGVPLSTETDDRVFVATGRWTSPDTFTVDVEIVGYSSFDRWEFRFEDRWLQLTEFGVAGDHTYRGTAE